VSARPENQDARVPHHCSHFDFDERALAVRASIFVEIVRELLPASP